MPFVDHKNNFVFVHIPKCGGRSIKKVFNIKTHDHYGISKLGFNPTNCCPKLALEDLFKFAFVRNPWDKFVSAYEYLKRGGIPFYDRPKTLTIKKEYPEFKDFLLAKEVWQQWVFFYPQLEFITVDGSIKTDFVGRFENFQNDFDLICDQIDYSKVKLPHVNKTKHAHYTEYYNDQSIKIIARSFEEDIDTFKYRFGD
tara:strand:- start:137 stop:730 length:594 start_codon:yes stop_codon:yes gene_type:complete